MSQYGVRSKLLLTLGVLVIALLAFVSVASGAPLAPNFTGTVTDATTGAPLAGIEVDAWYFDSLLGWTVWDWTTTAPDGTYALGGLPDGTYVVGFFDASLDHTTQYFDAQPSPDYANQFVISGGNGFTGVNASLALIPSVTGTISSARTSDPLDAIDVTAYRFDGSAWVAEQTVPSVMGAFEIFHLGTGIWRVGASDPSGRFRTSYYVAASDIASGADVVTNAGATTGPIDIAMPDETTAPVVSTDLQSTYSGIARFSITADDGVNGSGVASVGWRVDGGATSTVDWFSANVEVTGIGSHSVTYWATDLVGNMSAPRTVTFQIVASKAVREWGADRYSTAVAIARTAYPEWFGVTHVVLASGDPRAAADPLSASSLCWSYSAPLLLTRADYVPQSTKTALLEIVSANPRVHLYIVGGTGSVPDARIAEIAAYIKAARGLTDAELAEVVQPDRLLASGDRYDLSAAIIARLLERHPDGISGRAIVANGADQTKFFDALAASAVSAHDGTPILLVSSTAVPAATRSALTSLGLSPSDTFVVGGPATVAAGVLDELGIPAANRVWGANRYSTAVAVADKGWLGAEVVGIASQLPDALSGGVLAGSKNGPVLLTSPTRLSSETAAWLTAHRHTVGTSYVFGGPGSIWPAVATAIDNALK